MKTKAQLIDELAETQRVLAETETRLTELLLYVKSSKYDVNPYVHKNDVILRTTEILNHLELL